MVSSISNNSAFAQNSNLFNNSSKVYDSISQFDQAFREYGKEQTKLYADKFAKQENGGKTTVEELKKEIQQEFGMYKMLSSEPSNVVDGYNLLYIDDTNLQKMADDPEYKSKIFGLMRRESDSLGPNKIKMGSEVVNFRATGSIFSLSEKNESVDGIPYSGSANSMSFTVTNSSTSSKVSDSKDWLQELIEKIQKRNEEEKIQKRKEEEKKQNSQLDTYI